VDFLQGDFGLLGRGFNLLFFAQENGHTELEMHKLRGGGKDLRGSSLRENNPFGMAAKLLEDTFNEFHGIKGEKASDYWNSKVGAKS